jgi:hypothetical protein
LALFFDEADALFGKSTEVKDAHDRFASIEISYCASAWSASRVSRCSPPTGARTWTRRSRGRYAAAALGPVSYPQLQRACR